MKCQYQAECSPLSVVLKKLNYLKRLIGTALGFSFISVGGALLCLTIFPLIAILTRNNQKRYDRVRLVIHKTFKVYINFLIFLGVISLKTSHLNKLNDLKGVLLVCNHPSLLDVVIIIAQLRNVQCIVKSELWKNMFLGGVVRAAGYLPNDLSPELFYEKCMEDLSRGVNILIFPEGTRSIPGEPIKLQRSLAHLAFGARSNIQVLLMKCYPNTLIKGKKWYQIPENPPQYDLNATDLIKTHNYEESLPRSLRVRALTREIQIYYNRCLGYE